MSTNLALSVRGLSKSFPGVKALDTVSIDFLEGEVHALIGENGAGKSTLIKCIAGAQAPDEGSIVVGGTAYKALDPQLAARLGIAVIYQEFTLVPSLSVAENVFLCRKTSPSFIVDAKARQAKAAEIFRQLKVDLDPARPVRELSPAYQQIVEIAKAVSREVKVLIMDEPTAPLTTSEVEMLFGVVRDLQAKGVTIIYISHRLEELFEIADRATVMRDGAYVATKLISETSRGELIELMAGRKLGETYPERRSTLGNEALRVEDLSGNGVEHISFSLRRGEILGFAGLVGAGRTELMQVIYGAAPSSGGAVYLNGEKVRVRRPSDAIRLGIGLIPEDRKGLGLFLGKSIAWNTVINAIKSISRGWLVDRKREGEIAQEYRERFSIKTPSLEQMTGNLSGGNQQKVVIAKTLAANSRVIIFDEPTRGIDVGAKHEIYRLMNQLAEEGHAIIIVSSEMPELLGMCDRIIVIAEGRKTGELMKAEFDQTAILDLASRGRHSTLASA